MYSKIKSLSLDKKPQCLNIDNNVTFYIFELLYKLQYLEIKAYITS